MIRGTRRQLQTCGAVAVMALLTACSGGGRREESPAATRSSTAQGDGEMRSDRGNPPFYDVLGKRYHVLPTSAGYRARGVASWYGPDFHGLATSSGEQYDMNAMTAAHTTLPLPTWVEVTNLENGRSVVVKVNDRGPFVDDRLIDLSYAAATQLDMVRNGTARVEVRAVAAPYRQPIVAAAPPLYGYAAQPRAAGPCVPARDRAERAGRARADHGVRARAAVRVSAGDFAPARDFACHACSCRPARSRSATTLCGSSRASTADGFANSFIVSEGRGGRALHRVRLGPIRDSAEFDRVKARLLAAGVTNPQLVVDR